MLFVLIKESYNLPDLKYYVEYLILEEDNLIVNTMEQGDNFVPIDTKKSYVYRGKRRYINTKITIIFGKLKCNPSNMQCLLICFHDDKVVSVVDSSVLYNYIKNNLVKKMEDLNTTGLETLVEIVEKFQKIPQTNEKVY